MFRMQKTPIFMVSLVLVAAFSGIVQAASTNLPVSASVAGTCQFDVVGSLAFGALDQTSAGDATASTSIGFWCTKNALYTLSDPTNSDGAESGTITNGTDSITYSVTYDNFSGSGGGKTSPITSTINGTILNANYVNVSAGNYAGNMLFTITP